MSDSAAEIDAWIRARGRGRKPQRPKPPPPSHRTPDLKQGDRAADTPTPKRQATPDDWLRAMGKVKATLVSEAIEAELNKEL